jgi:hypothetical protein
MDTERKINLFPTKTNCSHVIRIITRHPMKECIKASQCENENISFNMTTTALQHHHHIIYDVEL